MSGKGGTKRKPIDKEVSKTATLIPCRRYSEYRSDLSQGTINGLILDRKENGLEKCIVRISNRLYLIVKDWDEWILSNRDSNKNKPSKK